MKSSIFRTIGPLALLGALAQNGLGQWPTFHGGPQRHGRSSVAGPATAPNLRWTFDFHGPAIGSPIVAQDGTIYIGPLWDESQKKPRSYFYAIRPDGTLKWRYEIPFNDKQHPTAPSIDPKGNVYFGDSLGTLRSLDASGELRWSRQGIQPIIAHTLVAGDRIYAHMDGALVAMSTSSGQPFWQFPLGANLPGGPTLALNGNIVSTGANAIVAVSPSGAQVWQSILAGGSSPIAVAPNGSIVSTGYFLQSLDPATGAIQWFENTGNSVNPDVTATIDSTGNLYFMKSWSVTKYSPQGTLVWEHMLLDNGRLGDAHTSFILDPANRLYVAAGWYKRAAIDIEKRVYCFNAQNGAIVWTFNLPEIPSPSSPAIGPDGTIYVGCTDGKLYALR